MADISKVNMILLQAAIAAGLFLVILLGIFLLVGVPILVGVLMKFVWRRLNKEEYITNKTPYYKDPVWFFLSVLVSIVILGYVFYLLLVLFDKLNPGWGLYT